MGEIVRSIRNQTLIERGKACIHRLSRLNIMTLDQSMATVNVAYELGYWCGLSQIELEKLEAAAYLHHTGYTELPLPLFHAEKVFAEKERKVLEQHVTYGEVKLKNPSMDEDVLEAVKHHHERWDGTGYPDGLKGEAIPIMSRIMAIADAYVAMVTRRIYRRPLTDEEIITRLKAESGKAFDPKLVGVMITLLEVSPQLLTQRLYTP